MTGLYPVCVSSLYACEGCWRVVCDQHHHFHHGVMSSSSSAKRGHTIERVVSVHAAWNRQLVNNGLTLMLCVGNNV